MPDSASISRMVICIPPAVTVAYQAALQSSLFSRITEFLFLVNGNLDLPVGHRLSLEVKAYAFRSSMADAQQYAHIPAHFGRRLLSEAADRRGGAHVPAAQRSRRSGSPQHPHRTQPPPRRAHHEKVLFSVRRSGRPDLHRHHRPHQRHLHLRRRQRRPPRHLRRQMCRK